MSSWHGDVCQLIMMSKVRLQHGHVPVSRGYIDQELTSHLFLDIYRETYLDQNRVRVRHQKDDDHSKRVGAHKD